MTKRQESSRRSVKSNQSQNERETGTKGMKRYSIIPDRIEYAKPYIELLGFAAALAVPLSAIRILAVANFDRNVALALVANAGGGDLVIALLILTIPTAVYLLAIALAADVGSIRSDRRLQKLMFLLAVSVYSALMANYWFELVLHAGFPILVATFFYLMDRKRHHEQSREENKKFLWSIVAATLVVTIANSSIWLAPERLVIENKAKVGHVLKAEGENLVIFFPEENIVLRVPRGAISERQYCTTPHRNPIRKGTRGSLPECPS